MKNEQALQILKEVLDAATKGGVFPNIDATFTAANAFNQIANLIKEVEKDAE
jgi:NCAIR mutase (PurE)-related protein